MRPFRPVLQKFPKERQCFDLKLGSQFRRPSLTLPRVQHLNCQLSTNDKIPRPSLEITESPSLFDSLPGPLVSMSRTVENSDVRFTESERHKDLRV